MRFAYADPPYLGYARKHYSDHPEHAKWDALDAHRDLVESLERDFDGWALSLASVNLWDILPLTPRPPRCRVGYWLKPFASYKPGVNPAYAWEPLIFAPGRKRTREQETLRDWHMANITLKRGLTGAKPESTCHWMFGILGMNAGDEFVDVFPGTGAVARAWETWCTMPQNLEAARG